MKKSGIKTLFALAFLAGCTARVNLARQRAAYDSFDSLVPRAEADYEVKAALLQEILKETKTPLVEPYPHLKADLAESRAAIKAMGSQLKSIDKAKQSFEAFAQGRSEVSSDNEGEWQAWQRVHGEFQAAAQQMNSHAYRHQNGLAQFDNRLKQFKVMKTDVNKVAADVSGFQAEYKKGMAEMQAGIVDGTKALAFAKIAGITNERMQQKSEVLGKMATLLPALLESKKAVEEAHKLVPKGDASGAVWTGPGMRGDLSKLEGFLAAKADYHKARQQYDLLKTDFEAAPTPTPAPTAVPAAAP